MYAPTTQWDRGPTDKELNAYYGKEPTQTRDNIIETLTDSIRKVSGAKLALPYVRIRDGEAQMSAYPLSEVVADYGVYGKPLDALLLALEKSDCPLISAYREVLATAYADAWADEIDMVNE